MNKNKCPVTDCSKCPGCDKIPDCPKCPEDNVVDCSKCARCPTCITCPENNIELVPGASGEVSCNTFCQGPAGEKQLSKLGWKGATCAGSSPFCESKKNRKDQPCPCIRDDTKTWQK